jgi:3-oxoadipate enol-lactonase
MAVLSYEISGSGPAVVLLHPIGLDRSFWSSLPAVLAHRNTVIAVDTAGHGASPDAARPGSMRDRVDQAAALLEEIGPGKATLVGVSFGGMIAQQLALERPDLVSGLVLGGCPAAIPVQARKAIHQRGADAEASGMAAVVDATLDRWFTAPFLPSPEAARVRARLLSDSPANWAAGWEAIAGHDALGRLGSLTMPALVIAGELDTATPLEAKRELAAAIPGSKLIILRDAPHMMHLECPDPFAEAVSDFLLSTGHA